MAITENPTGRSYWFDGCLLDVLVSAADTGDTLSLCRQTLPAGYGTPVHCHEREDQTLYVLSGQITGWLDPNGDRVEQVVAADEAIFLPRGVPHAFRVDEEGTSLLEINSPGGFENFHIEAGEPARFRGLPEPSEPDIAKLVRHADGHDCEIQGPPV